MLVTSLPAFASRSGGIVTLPCQQPKRLTQIDCGKPPWNAHTRSPSHGTLLSIYNFSLSNPSAITRIASRVLPTALRPLASQVPGAQAATLLSEGYLKCPDSDRAQSSSIAASPGLTSSMLPSLS